MKNCRYFNGYKPCGRATQCDSLCTEFSPVQQNILIIGLGAMGAVLRATAVLPPLVRQKPGAHITWMTEGVSKALLENNPLIDQVLGCEFNDVLKIEGRAFDAVYVMDKDQRVSGLLDRVKYRRCLGFKVDSRFGVVVPAQVAALELYELGLNNEKKFFQNSKSEIQLLTEAFELKWQKDPYVLQLTASEQQLSQQRARTWSHQGQKPIVGINTGCSPTIPHKKLSVAGHRKLIRKLQKNLPDVSIVLLGGPEDSDRNQEISQGLNVIVSPTQNGLRDGIASVEACDVVISGDSLGMHMAIALKKWVIAWFGPTCEQEIELYGRGDKILSSAKCSPCWKRVCDHSPMCYDLVELSSIVEATKRGLHCISPLSKLPSWATFS